MTAKSGVWIDHHHAIVVLVTPAGEDVRHILSDEGKAAQVEAGPQASHSYTRNDFVAEDKLERKSETRRNHYYDEVIACLPDAGEILVFGPGEAKGEFAKRMESKQLAGRIGHVGTADKMTDRQISAYVRERFQ